REIEGVVEAVAYCLEVGQRPTLVVAVTTDSSCPGESTIRDRCAEALPSSMAPGRVVAIPGGFPRNANGKTDLAELRKLVEVRLRDRAVRPNDLPADGHEARVR